MKKILIYRYVQENEYAIWDKTDYSQLDKIIQTERKGNCPNYGNKVWLQGLISELSTDEVEYFFWNPKMSYEEINSQFDCMIKPCANIFSIDFANRLKQLAEIFSHITIPIYIIACGIQLEKYEDMDEVIRVIKEPATEFIKAVYATGGEFALRGYITKEFFSKLGFESAVVTGCPSIYQNGRELQIHKEEIPRNEFKAIVNGQNYLMSTSFYMNIFRDFPQSVFIDQDHYYNYLYNPNYFDDNAFSLKDLIVRVKDKGYLGLDLVSSNRLQLFVDIPNWKMYLEKEKFSFSFGARIHGNIMSLLSGIPALLHPCDCRTEEMADFFEIPIITDKELKEKKDLYEIYQSVDYDKFNKNFKEKYDFFEKFFIDRGLIDTHLNQDNIFWRMENNCNGCIPYKINQKKLEQMRLCLNKYDKFLSFESKIFSKYRKYKRKWLG